MNAPLPMVVNWIGLWTMVRREVSRMMRVPIQAFIAPWISALLFIFIFGFVVGGRISSIGGHRYLEFVLPGILMMNIVNASFLQSSSQIYFSRFLHYVEETLVAPLSYVEMIVGSLTVVVLRTTVTATGILLMGALFGVVALSDLGEFLFWVVSTSVIFGLLGISIGLWARNFEQLNLAESEEMKEDWRYLEETATRLRAETGLQVTTRLAMGSPPEFGNSLS